MPIQLNSFQLIRVLNATHFKQWSKMQMPRSGVVEDGSGGTISAAGLVVWPPNGSGILPTSED